MLNIHNSQFANFANPPAPYLGGKRLLAKSVVQFINSRKHTTYAEPFLGMGGVFFRRSEAAKCEVINDISKDVINLFRVTQRHFEALERELSLTLSSRSEFERYQATNPDTLTDIERAARFIYLQRTAFGGKISGRNFGVSVGRPGRANPNNYLPNLKLIHERLSGVIIENLSYIRFIERYDRAGTLFYLDPPYWGCEDDYGKNLFSRCDFFEMAKLLSSIKGSFVFSINDTPQIRNTFQPFNLNEVQLNYSIAKDKGTQAKELIITNF